MKDLRVFRGAEINRDHYKVAIKMRIHEGKSKKSQNAAQTI